MLSGCSRYTSCWASPQKWKSNRFKFGKCGQVIGVPRLMTPLELLDEELFCQSCAVWRGPILHPPVIPSSRSRGSEGGPYNFIQQLKINVSVHRLISSIITNKCMNDRYQTVNNGNKNHYLLPISIVSFHNFMRV